MQFNNVDRQDIRIPNTVVAVEDSMNEEYFSKICLVCESYSAEHKEELKQYK